MIKKNYKERVDLEDAKMSELKSAFPSFFKKEDPQPVTIQINSGFFFDASHSFGGSQFSVTSMNYKSVKKAPNAELVQLSYSVVDEKGRTDLYSYSDIEPISKDANGLNYEYPVSSGNTVSIGHGVSLYPRVNDELLYFLYFYCPLFENGSIGKGAESKYSFSQPEIVQKASRAKLSRENEVFSKVSSLDDAGVSRVLRGMFKPVAEDADTNFNTLFIFMKEASEEQWASFNDLAKSSKTKEASVAVDSIGDVIQTLLENEKIMVVDKPSDDFPKIGWYWKGQKGSEEENNWLKTPFMSKVKESSQDHRIDLADYLSNNTELLNKLKNRY